MKRFWASGLPAIILFTFGIVWGGLMVLQPRSGEPVAALFSPTASGATALGGAVHAGADIVIGTGAMDNIVIARSVDPSFVARLQDAGALMVVRAPLAGYCRN